MSGAPEGQAFLSNALSFVALLRRAGLPVTLGQALDFLRGLELIGLDERRRVFHTARALLVTRREDLALFTALFESFWSTRWTRPESRGQRAPRAPRHDRQPERPFTIVRYMALEARRLEREVDVSDRSGTFTDQEVLQRKDFSAMTPEELRAVRRMIEDLRWQAALRRTRRREPYRRGQLPDARRTLRLAARQGGVPLRLCRQRRKVKPRPLVLLADVSGSMEKLSRLVLLLFYGVSHGLGNVETFVFGTRLTRITPQLRLRNIDRAVDDAARAVHDWSGGTRIGECLREFHRRWGRRVLRRGAVVVVVSDGWDRGDTVLLRSQMHHLQLRCHRLVWLIPLAGKRGYQPRVEGMAAALPYVDDFLPVHNLQCLEELAERLASLPGRRRGIFPPGRPRPSFDAREIRSRP